MGHRAPRVQRCDPAVAPLVAFCIDGIEPEQALAPVQRDFNPLQLETAHEQEVELGVGGHFQLAQGLYRQLRRCKQREFGRDDRAARFGLGGGRGGGGRREVAIEIQAVGAQ